jgi:O-antigen/teichoic acid export membrane protein
MPSSIKAARAIRSGTWPCVWRGEVQNWFRSGILRNAAWMLSGRGLQLAGRIAYYLIIARALGPTGYGTFVACTALVAVMAPFAHLGSGHVMIKYTARNRHVFSAYFGNALLTTLAFGSVLTGFALLIRPKLLPASVTALMLMAVAIADLLGLQMTNICLQAFQALEQFRRYAQLLALQMAARLIAALALAGSHHTPLHWAYLYAASALIPMIGGLVPVSWCCASPHFRLKLFVPSVREGFHFSTTIASMSIYGDIDKAMLARLSTVESAAIYAVAYRFIEASLMPIRSVAEASYPEFFRQGMQGVTSAFGFAKRILRRSVVYGLSASVVMFVGAGLVPVVFGTAYNESAVALRWLCGLALINSVQAFLRDVLTGANYQGQRSSLDIAMAILNVLINLWVIRTYAWRGAAWSSLMTDSLLLVLTYLIIRWHLRRERALAGAATSPQPIAAVDGLG